METASSNSADSLYKESIPEDLYYRRPKDRLMSTLSQIVGVYERLTQISSWTSDTVEEVPRILQGIITKREMVADEIVALTFRAPNNALFPVWNPGAHIDLKLPSGRRRQYSLSGNPQKRTELRIAVRRLDHGGGGSVEVHEALKEGDTIEFEGPRNAFQFGTSSGRVLFIIGGIGITPILPMIKVAHRRGFDWHAVFAGRSRSTMAFLDELTAISPDEPHRVRIWADDEQKTMAKAEDLLEWADDATSVYICGPVPMMDAVIKVRSAIAGAALYYERFSPPPVINEQPFTLELARSGVSLAIPSDRSALDVMLDYNPHFAYSCRQGFCGTCKVKVLGGEPKLRAKGSETAEEILICMSRSQSETLIIDS